MSNFREIKITCPICNEEHGYTIWDSINVQVNPEMKDQILNKKLFDWECPKCGNYFNIPYGFIYHDMEEGFLIAVAANYDEIVKEFTLPDGYTYLRVKDLDELCGIIDVKNAS